MIPDIAFTWRYKGFKSRTLSLTTLGTTCIQKIGYSVNRMIQAVGWKCFLMIKDLCGLSDGSIPGWIRCVPSVNCHPSINAIPKIEIRVSGIGILASEIQEISRQRLLGGCIVPSAECPLGNGLCPASSPFRRSWMLPVVSRYVIAAEVGGEINVLLPSVSYAKETLRSPLHDPFLPLSGRLEFPVLSRSGQ